MEKSANPTYIDIASAADWAAWLADNHDRRGEVWLRIAKKLPEKCLSQFRKLWISSCVMGGSTVTASRLTNRIIYNDTRRVVQKAHGHELMQREQRSSSLTGVCNQLDSHRLTRRSATVAGHYLCKQASCVWPIFAASTY